MSEPHPSKPSVGGSIPSRRAPAGFTPVLRATSLKPGMVIWVDGIGLAAALTLVLVKKTPPAVLCECGRRRVCPGWRVIGAAKDLVAQHSIAEGVKLGRIYWLPGALVDVSRVR